MSRPYILVDVFGSEPFSGNALPVIAEADGLDSMEMQRITRWFGYSETAFLLAPTEPGADYRTRIFTLDRELPFAGHPTLGSCHAWRETGGQPNEPGRMVQQCGAGLIDLRASADTLAFSAPPLVRSGPLEEGDTASFASFLGIERGDILESAWIDNGPGWAGVILASPEALLALQPPSSWPERIELGVIAPYPAGSGAAYEVRSFFSGERGAVLEDPITGSLNASIAQWIGDRFATPYVAHQGTAIGRKGRIAIDRDEAGRYWIGGRTVTVASGTAPTL